MAKGPAIQVTPKPKPKTYTVTINAIPPVAFAVPGVRKVVTGDFIVFHNKTGGPVRISVAADDVLTSAKKLKPMLISNGKKRKFKVKAVAGTHELSIHYSYWEMRKKERYKLRTGFAIGASSPKIIVVPPKR
jgi:hypothetical protein